MHGEQRCALSIASGGLIARPQFDRLVQASPLGLLADRLTPNGKQIGLGVPFGSDGTIDGFDLLVAHVGTDRSTRGEGQMSMAHHDFGDAAAFAQPFALFD